MEKKKASFKAPTFSVPSKAKDQVDSSKSQESLRNTKKTMKEEKSGKSYDTCIFNVGIDKKTKSRSLKKDKRVNKTEETDKVTGDTNTVNSKGEGGDVSGVTAGQENLEPVSSNITCKGDNMIVANQQEVEFTKNQTVTVKGITDKNEDDKVSYIQLQPVKLPEVSETSLETGNVKPVSDKNGHECSARDKERKHVKKGILPVRSLTDDEYESIFTAAVENVLNMNIDEWNPKCSSTCSLPKKYKKTVGKPVTTSTEKKTECVNGSVCKNMEENKEKKEKNSELKKKEKNGQKSKENAHPLKLKVLAKNTVDINKRQQEENKSHVEVQRNSHRIEAQVENETTPAGSDDELVSTKVPHTPPRKKLKSSKVPKKAKLEPRELPFASDEKAVKSGKRKNKTSYSDKAGKKSNSQTDSISESSIINNERKTEDRRKEMLTREISLEGTWVQCCKTDCLKWRYLPAVSDPSNIPDYWTCSMNPGKEYNSCDKEEEYYDESTHIYTKYCEGSIVWAKTAGYPWWPAMIEIDPDLDVYFETDKKNDMVPAYYHVVFLDDKVSRIWVKAGQLVPFDEGHNLNDSVKRKKKGSSFEKDISAAKRNAIKALSYPLQERIKMFGFAAKYKGHWGSTEDSTAKVKYNKNKTSKKQKTKCKEEMIDDSTMDDVLGNTEALLSNVEEMLDSLDSDLDDSCEDSDFSIDELICLEREKMKVRNEKANEEEPTTNGEEEAALPEKSVAGNKNNESKDEILQINVVDDYEETEEKTSSLASEALKRIKLNLDPEIFTMELEDDKNTDNNLTENAIHNEKDLSEKIRQTKDFEADDKTNEHRKCLVGKETAELKQSKKKFKKSMEEKSDEKSELNTGKNKNGLKKKSTTKKEAHTKSKSANKIKPVGKFKKPFTDETNEHSLERDVKQINMDCDIEHRKENVMETAGSLGNGNENLELIENGETSDTGKLHSDTKSSDKENCTVTGQDRVVPYNLGKTDEEKDLSTPQGISLDDESGTEFDLVEHSMYDGTRGADKMVEREPGLLSNQTSLVELDAEDSDPFDMMEE